MGREYVSTECNCRRSSVIVHRSANDNLGVDALGCIGKLACLWHESFPPKDICVWQIASNQRFVNDIINSLLANSPSVHIYTHVTVTRPS